MGFVATVRAFLNQAGTSDLKTQDYPNEYRGTKVTTSFGQGQQAKVPWISFLLSPNTTSNGVYPVYLYFKDQGLLILAYGVSETNNPEMRWQISGLTIEAWFSLNGKGKPPRYGGSYVHSVYNVHALPDDDRLDDDLEDIVSRYKELVRMKYLPLSNVHYWLYAPGEKANRWEEFYAAGEMAIAWDNLGDLSRYKSQEEIIEKLAEHSEHERRQTNNSRACYEFASVLKKGDVVIVKKGSWDYVGWGIVESDYFYDESRSDYQHVRKVRWCARGSWTEKLHRIVLKTLTDITKYPDYVERLVAQIGIDIDQKRTGPSEVTSNLNPLNTILFGPPGTGKTYNTVNKALEIIDPSFMSTNPVELLSKVDLMSS